ncbi:heat shock protein 30C-like [Candoia aspera]|uniref:heat shock protein 30C-like n=1 Tax=Candoia aspera TaxID=51853 RepID=UPI002FD7D543
MASYSYRRSQPVRILQEPGQWAFGREPEAGARRPGGPPSLYSQLMGDMQSHLDEMDRLRVVLLDAYPLLALGEEAGPAGKGPLQPRQPRARSRHQLALDVGGFAPEELSVKLEGRKLTVLGKHEKEEAAEDGCVSREYREVRRELLLPADANLEAVTCALAPDGQLRIEAPRLERTIRVTVERSPAEASEAAGRQTSPGAGEERDGAGEK